MRNSREMHVWLHLRVFRGETGALNGRVLILQYRLYDSASNDAPLNELR